MDGLSFTVRLCLRDIPSRVNQHASTSGIRIRSKLGTKNSSTPEARRRGLACCSRIGEVSDHYRFEFIGNRFEGGDDRHSKEVRCAGGRIDHRDDGRAALERADGGNLCKIGSAGENDPGHSIHLRRLEGLRAIRLGLPEESEGVGEILESHVGISPQSPEA